MKLIKTPVAVSRDYDDNGAICLREENGNILLKVQGNGIAIGIASEVLEERATHIANIINRDARIKASVDSTTANGEAPDLMTMLKAALPEELKRAMQQASEAGEKRGVDLRKKVKAEHPPVDEDLLGNLPSFLTGQTEPKPKAEAKPETESGLPANAPEELHELVRHMKSMGAEISIQRVGSLNDMVSDLLKQGGKFSQKMGESLASGNVILHIKNRKTLAVLAAMLIKENHSYGSEEHGDGTFDLHTCPCGYDVLRSKFGDALKATPFEITNEMAASMMGKSKA